MGVAVRLEVGVGSKMAAVKTICKFLLYSMLISAVFCDSTEDFLSNYEEAEDEHNSQIASDNPTYSETSTHSGNSEPYLDVDVMTDEELQEAVTKQSLDDPENLNEVTSTKSPDIKSLNNESEKKEAMEAFENKHDLSPHESRALESVKRSSDDVDKIPETTTTSSDTNGDDVIEYTDGGVACKSKCEKNGQEYFWCWQITGSWDYCIPAVVPTISTTTETTTITTTKKPTTSETTTTESSTTTTEFLTTTTKPTTTMKSTTTTTEHITTTTEPSITTTEPTTTTTEPSTTTTEPTTTTTESTSTTTEPTTTTLE